MGLLTWCIHEDGGQGTTKRDIKRQEWDYLLCAFIRMGDKVQQRETIKKIKDRIRLLTWCTHEDGGQGTAGGPGPHPRKSCCHLKFKYCKHSIFNL